MIATDHLEAQVRKVQRYLGGRRLTVGAAEVSANNLDSFLPSNWYSAQTFQLLRATVHIPTGFIVIISDERFVLKSLPVKRVLLICFQEHRRHWVLVDAEIETGTLTYHDSLLSSAGTDARNTIGFAINKITTGLLGAGISNSVFTDIQHRCTIQQTDTSSCGPFVWREVQALLGYKQRDNTPLGIRLRHCTKLLEVVMAQSKSQTTIEVDDSDFSEDSLPLDAVRDPDPTPSVVSKTREASPLPRSAKRARWSCPVPEVANNLRKGSTPAIKQLLRRSTRLKNGRVDYDMSKHVLDPYIPKEREESTSRVPTPDPDFSDNSPSNSNSDDDMTPAP